MTNDATGADTENVSFLVNRVSQSALFHDIPRSLIQLNQDRLQVERFADGQAVLAEGENNHCVFLVVAGEVSVWTSADDSAGGQHRIATLGKGEEFGEVSLIDGQGASATIRAEGTATIIRVNLTPDTRRPEVGRLSLRVQEAVGQRVAARLRQHNRFSVAALERELEENRLRAVAGHFVILVVVLSTLYTIAMKVVSDLEMTWFLEVYASPIIILVFVSGILTMMKLSAFPFGFFGVTMKDWWPATRDAIAWSILFCAAMTLIRWLYIQLIGDGSGQVFQVARTLARYDEQGNVDWVLYFLVALGYIALCPVQELACRCGAQAPMYAFLQGTRRQRHLWSIVASNLLFAAAHSHLNLMFSVLTFIPGLFWGWLFMRHRSIIGVSVSHAMIGVYALFALGAEDLLR